MQQPSECCGAPIKHYIKNGVLATKCKKCGVVACKGKVERSVGLSDKQAVLKTDYEESLKKALMAKYDIMFNFTPATEEDSAKLLAAECLKKKKLYEKARQKYVRALELPDPAKLLGIDVAKQMKTANTAAPYKAQKELENSIWKIKYRTAARGERPPLERVWWFDLAEW